MKWLISFLAILATALGAAYGFHTLIGPPVVVHATPDTKLTINYPENTPDKVLTESNIESIKRNFEPYLPLYKSATLHINCYPPMGTIDSEDQANFQLVIISDNGCILESKRTYTTKSNLVRKIQEKIKTAFTTLTANPDTMQNASKITF